MRIITNESSVGEFAQASFFPFLLSLRVPSGAMMLRRAFSPDPTDGFTPHPEKALIGARIEGGSPFLTPKFPWWGDLVAGRILRRPFFCPHGWHDGGFARPSPSLSASGPAKSRPGLPLFSAVDRRKFNRILRALFPKIHEPADVRYSSNAFPRGASLGIKESGPPWSVVASPGVWHSPAFRVYGDMPRGVKVGAHQLFGADVDSDSEAEEPVRLWVARLRKTPWPAGPAASPWVSGFPESARAEPFIWREVL